MKIDRNHLRMAVLACFAPLAMGAPAAYADAADELKSEIQAQRALLEPQHAQIEAQRARLEALEKRLEAATAAPQAPAAPAPSVAARPQAVPEPARTVVASGDWAPGFTFRATPVDTVTLY